MSTSVISNRTNLPNYSALRAVLSTTQSTDIGSNDHIKWGTITHQYGSDITLDTTSAYTNGGGASIGRFTLKGGKTYRVGVNLSVQMSAAGALQVKLYNVTSGVWSATGTYAIAGVGGNSVSDTGGLTDFLSPTSDTMYEVRIWSATNLTSIFSSTGEPHIVIETVAAQVPYTDLNVFQTLIVRDIGTSSATYNYTFDLSGGITSWTTVATITPTVITNTWWRGLVTCNAAGHTSGIANGALSQAVQYFEFDNATPGAGAVSAGTSSGAGAPQFRVIVSGSTFLCQVQSSNGANLFQGTAAIEILTPAGGGTQPGYTITTI